MLQRGTEKLSSLLSLQKKFVPVRDETPDIMRVNLVSELYVSPFLCPQWLTTFDVMKRGLLQDWPEADLILPLTPAL